MGDSYSNNHRIRERGSTAAQLRRSPMINEFVLSVRPASCQPRSLVIKLPLANVLNTDWWMSMANEGLRWLLFPPPSFLSAEGNLYQIVIDVYWMQAGGRLPALLEVVFVTASLSCFLPAGFCTVQRKQIREHFHRFTYFKCCLKKNTNSYPVWEAKGKCFSLFSLSLKCLVFTIFTSPKYLFKAHSYLTVGSVQILTQIWRNWTTFLQNYLVNLWFSFRSKNKGRNIYESLIVHFYLLFRYSCLPTSLTCTQ